MDEIKKKERKKKLKRERGNRKDKGWGRRKKEKGYIE